VKLYFYGSNRKIDRDESGSGVIAFAVPDIGFVFRSAHRGDALECEYFALLTLSRFVEANAKIFKGQKLEFMGDSTAVVHRVGGSAGPLVISPILRLGLHKQALVFKKKLGFSLHWVPLKENRAALELNMQPTVKSQSLASELVTDFLGVEHFKKPGSSGGSRDGSALY
jgi:hypothetical protein